MKGKTHFAPVRVVQVVGARNESWQDPKPMMIFTRRIFRDDILRVTDEILEETEAKMYLSTVAFISICSGNPDVYECIEIRSCMIG